MWNEKVPYENDKYAYAICLKLILQVIINAN